MTELKTDALKPLTAARGEPAFEEAWQAQALAMADSLVKRGLFSANEWSATLGRFLAESEQRGDEDTLATYYACVLQALEELIDSNSDINRQTMTDKRKDWEQAYLSTPHGQPVKLK